MGWRALTRTNTASAAARSIEVLKDVSFECLDMREHSFGEALERITAFQNAYDAAVCAVGRDFAREDGQVGKIFVGETELSQRIALSRVKACADENEFRPKRFHGGNELGFESAENLGATAPCGEGAVERGAGTFAPTGLVGVSRSRIPRVLVGAEKENVRVFVKDILSAVAVVNVPIDDEDSADAEVFTRMRCGNGNVVEHAKSHADGRPRVMSGGANHAEGGVRFVLHDRARCRDGASCSGKCGFPGGFANLGVAGAQMIIARVDFALGKLEIRGGMNKAQIRRVDCGGRLKSVFIGQSRCFQS